MRAVVLKVIEYLASSLTVLELGTVRVTFLPLIVTGDGEKLGVAVCDTSGSITMYVFVILVGSLKPESAGSPG